MRPMMGILTTLLVASAVMAQKPVPPDHPQRAKAGLELFRQQVRGLLTEHCLKCHGGESVKADFDLSTREKLMAGGYVADTAADSYLIELIEHTAEPHMPLKAPKLPDTAIAAIRKWIDLGAPYDKPLVEGKGAPAGPKVITDRDRQWWSFQPLRQPEVPVVADAAWGRTTVDRFIRAAQEKAGLRPNGQAEPRVLIRRAYFDLIGLPPTPEEMAALLAEAENAPDLGWYERLLAKLLDSPHYGERWARHWLDIARFAESHGYEQDYNRNHAYHYRDFVIKAYNQDMPFDQFLRWQLAGDELAPEDPLAWMATGFLSAGAFPTQLTEAEFESARYDELDDMVGTTGVAFLGLSVGCARCHDHKYDPILARDYYQMAATFATAIRSEIELDLDPAENARRRQAHADKLAQLNKQRADYEQAGLNDALTQWLQKFEDQTSVDPWRTLPAVEVTSSAKTAFEVAADGVVFAKSPAPAKETLTLSSPLTLDGLVAFRLEALTHESLPGKGPGRAANGNFALGDFRVAIVGPDGKTKPIKLVAARATHQQNDSSLSVAASIDGDPITGWAVDGQIGKDQAAVFEAAEPVTVPAGHRLVVTLALNHPNAKHTLGRFRVTVSRQLGLPPTVGGTGLDPTLLEQILAAKQAGDRTSSAWAAVRDWYRPQDPQWQQLSKQIDDLSKAGPALLLAKAQVTSENVPKLEHHANGRGFPHFYPEVHFLTRGDIHQKGDVMGFGFPLVLAPVGVTVENFRRPPAESAKTSHRRATLARWITDTERGAGALAARVAVNRVWQHHFGKGIVGTPSDFGLQGDEPTHPDLLEWLAADFVAHGWKVKRLHQQIMTSSVYLQHGQFDEERATLDRENRLLWHRPARRLDAEPIRDAMLSVAGVLDTRPFGPGSLDANMRRRSIYFFIKRSDLVPMMMLFDWPEHLVSIGARANTIIAPQALAFLNSPQVRQYAEAFATRLAGSSAEEKIAHAYRLALSRPPSSAEVAAVTAFLTQQTTAHTQAGKPNPDALAWADFCQAVFSMNEFVYVD